MFGLWQLCFVQIAADAAHVALGEYIFRQNGEETGQAGSLRLSARGISAKSLWKAEGSREARVKHAVAGLVECRSRGRSCAWPQESFEAVQRGMGDSTLGNAVALAPAAITRGLGGLRHRAWSSGFCWPSDAPVRLTGCFSWAITRRSNQFAQDAVLAGGAANTFHAVRHIRCGEQAVAVDRTPQGPCGIARGRG